MEPESQTLTFAQLLAETGLTQGEAIAALYKLGRDVFAEGLNRATFNEVEVSILKENMPARPQQKVKTKRPRQRTQTKPSGTKLPAKDSADSARSLFEIAEYFGTGVDVVQQACVELNIKSPHVDFRLGAKKAEQLRNHLATSTYSSREELCATSDHLGETPLLVESSQKNQSSAGSAPRHLLLDKLAHELGTSIDDVKRVMVILRIPVPAGSRPKVTTSQARRISEAVVMHNSLPTDRMNRGEVRIRPLLDRHEVSIKAGQEFCRKRGIVLTHGKYCSVDDGLRLLLHLADPSTLDHLRRWTDPRESAQVPVEAAQEPSIAVNYEGISLSRQDFSGYTFAGANLRGADLSFSNLSGADLSGADLSGANLTRATCARTNFASANCTEVIFENAVLNLADFTEADLTRATLIGCKVHHTNFTRSNLTGANLVVPKDEYVILGQTTWIDGRTVNKVSEIEKI